MGWKKDLRALMYQGLQMCDFTKINEINKGLKTLLEDKFKKIYLEKIERKNNNEEEVCDLFSFKIDKKGLSIFEKITSIDALDEVKKEIIKRYDEFSEEFSDYFGRVEDQLDERQIKSFEIIDKMIKHRGKKLKSTIDKFMVKDGWCVAKIKDEFYFKVQHNLKDIVDDLLPAISTGMRENTAYEGIMTYFNIFLSQLGVYTKVFEANQKCDYEFLSPQECDNCETSDLDKKDVIKEVLSYPYILADNKIIVEGKVILWRIVNNG